MFDNHLRSDTAGIGNCMIQEVDCVESPKSFCGLHGEWRSYGLPGGIRKAWLMSKSQVIGWSLILAHGISPTLRKPTGATAIQVMARQACAKLEKCGESQIGDPHHDTRKELKGRPVHPFSPFV